MEKFKSFITEAKEEKYRLLIVSHDDPHDPNETGALVRKKAQELGLDVFLAEFSGMYVENNLVHSFPVNDKGQAEFPDIGAGAGGKDRESVNYETSFKINPKDTLVMARGIGSTIKTGNRSWWVAIKRLEDQGYFVINSTKCNDICNDKWYNQLVF